MTDMKRRSFLGAAAASAAAATAIPGKATAGLLDGISAPTEEEHRVVIIGSGFGGGVSALRLSKAGVPVTVLERGRWWHTGPNADCFPRASNPDERALWYGAVNPWGAYSTIEEAPGLLGLPDGPSLHAGVLDPVADPNMTVVVPTGVGGGSLVYQGMTLQPSEAEFTKAFPGIDYNKMDKKYYPRVARMLHAATAPDELINSPTYKAPRAWKARAEAAGYTVEKIPMPIDWSWALRELDGEMEPAYTNGDAALGVNNGGKYSVDVTYLKEAMDTGLCDVRELHNVQSIARKADGRWVVNVDVTDVTGKVLERKVLVTKALILSAGSVGTTRLLQKARFYNSIPGLSSEIGKGWGTNGDRILFWRSPNDDFGPIQGGPVIYGSKEWDDPDYPTNTIIQASMPPTGGLQTDTTTTVGFGVSDTRGEWVYDPLTDKSHLIWPREGDLELHTRILERMYAITGTDSELIDSHLVAPMTWHPLGGANMYTVCDTEGRVYDQPGLYVLDGSLIPGTTCACNPSMTIAAISERAMDIIVKNDVGTLI